MKVVIILYMKYIIMLLLLIGCAQTPPKSYKDDLVSLDAALNHAQASYLKGCVDAFHDLKIPGAFTTCRDKSLIHRRELDSIMEQDL
jgi:hypothetical protein